jgi:hypothetical protein
MKPKRPLTPAQKKKKHARQEVEGAAAMAAYRAGEEALRVRTAKLRAERIARQSADTALEKAKRSPGAAKK